MSPDNANPLCENGCGNKATHYAKTSDKYVCNIIPAKCPAIAAKIKKTKSLMTEDKKQRRAEKYIRTCKERYGPDPHKKFRRKADQTCMEKYGTANPLSVKEFRKKAHQTCVALYGENYQSQFAEQAQQTCIDRYGHVMNFSSDEFQATFKRIMLERHGFENPSHMPDNNAKYKATMLKRYGVDHISKSPEFREKLRKSLLKKYGVENVMQIPAVVQKSHKAAFKWKMYTFPSGRKDCVQGYEPKALDQLLQEGYHESAILTSKSDMPHIRYEIDGSFHRYFPDIFIPSQNLIIEVKSDYTLQRDVAFQQKKEATLRLGFSYRLLKY